MRLLVISDTHVPGRARDLPAQVWAEVDRADVVVHAGDWLSLDLLEAVQSRARRLLACWGNKDGGPLRARLPEIATAALQGIRIAVVHETGQAAEREMRVDRRFPETDRLIFGHSHIPWDSTTPSGLRLLNPGSPTDRRRQPVCTYLTVELGAAGIGAVTLVPVSPPYRFRL